MPETRNSDELTQFASDLQVMKHRAISLCLYATGQRLDWAIRMAGFEIAGDPESCSKYGRLRLLRQNFKPCSRPITRGPIRTRTRRVQTAAIMSSKCEPTEGRGNMLIPIVPSVESSSAASMANTN